ncbi:MAG TPA: hypothetical protein VN176_02265 [Verrucomicrobiae bacterium]|jgi:hypothetical protein|nr:hypothetical protein [Verrucomicrobiae bacterium]
MNLSPRLCAFSLYLTVLSLTGVSAAQISSRSNAIQTLRCVDQKGLSAPLSEQKQWQVSFARDVKSYPGEEHIIAVVFSGAHSGQVFDMQRKRAGTKISLNIVNNSDLVIKKGEPELVDALWGVWTQEHLRANVLKAMRNRKFLIKAEELQKAFPNVACSSYADP